MSYLKNKYDEKKIGYYYLISLIPLFFYGLYKNGLLLYSYDYITISELIFLLFIFFGGIGIVFLKNFIFKKTFTLRDFYLIACLLFLPVTHNIFLFLILYVIFVKFSHITPFSSVIFLLLIYFLNYFLNTLSFLNIYERTMEFNYTAFDLFVGRDISYVFTSSMLFALVSYFIMCTNMYYKREVAGIFLIVYSILVFCFNDITLVGFQNFSGIFLSIVYFGSYFEFVPLKKRDITIYSVLLAVVIYLCNIFLSNFIGCFIGILLVHASYKLFLKFFDNN